jgi:hypothetical protein
MTYDTDELKVLACDEDKNAAFIQIIINNIL